MITKKKTYFSFFGVLAATVNRKMHSHFSAIITTNSQNIPKITKLLFAKQLKPIKQYSTNSI